MKEKERRRKKKEKKFFLPWYAQIMYKFGSKSHTMLGQPIRGFPHFEN